VSWRILTDDLETAYRQLAAGRPADLGAKTTSFKEWAHRLNDHVAGGELDHELDYWQQTVDGDGLPVDGDGIATVGTAETVTVRLSAEDSEALLRKAPVAYRTRINDVLLGALAWAVSRWTNRDRVMVALESHGREETFAGVDLSRTVGWFTTVFPVALTVSGGDDWPALVKSVRRQLRSVPGNGFGYGALRYLCPPGSPGAKLADHAEPQIVFNYLGQYDNSPDNGTSRLYHAMHPPIGQDQPPTDRRTHLVEIVGGSIDGRLEFSWYYSPEIHTASTISAVADDFRDALRGIARRASRSAHSTDG
jgi:non-ribosomal peptide synthase protein (TIGR01720 family)